MATSELNHTISALIRSADSAAAGSPAALFTSLYRELHRLARRELLRHGGALTIGTTEVLHEAYLNMAGRRGPEFPDRGRFMGYAARVMRGLIVDHSRSRRAAKRGGGVEPSSAEPELAASETDATLEELSDALDALGAVAPALAEIVDLKFFCGFSFAEIGALHGVSERTVQRQWEKARVYLHRNLRHELAS
jgi:RNA polymerase sigma factor (TIGR02999 family)